MHLEDRIELSNKVFNVYTAYSKLRHIIHSVLYVEDTEKCKIVKFTSEPVTTKDIDMKLSSLHNKMLAKLFHALKKNPTNPEKELEDSVVKEEVSIKNTEDTSKNATDSVAQQTDNYKKELKSSNEPHWNKFYQDNLPKFAKCAFLINDNGADINAYSKDNIPDYFLDNILSINKFLKENIDKIYRMVGQYNNVIFSTDKELYFFYPISKENILVIITQKGPLGLYMKELDDFRQMAIDTLNLHGNDV